MIVYDEFKNYYIEHGMCKGDAFRRKNEYTEAELKTKIQKIPEETQRGWHDKRPRD